jgi:hypothetical protein
VAYTTKYFTQNIFHTMVDEGTSTCVMSLAFWKAISQPILSPFPTLLTAFDVHSLIPHGIILVFPMQLGGKTVCVKVEVVDAPLDYNLLLGRTWTYEMHVVVATVFWVLLFPHKGQIVTIDQLSFSCLDPSSRESTVPMIDNPQLDIVNVGVVLCPPLMGTFYYPPPFGNVKLISASPDKPKAEIFQVLLFQMNYFHDPQTLPSPSTLMNGKRHPDMTIPLSTAEVAYRIVQQASTDPDMTPTQELDPVLEPI